MRTEAQSNESDSVAQIYQALDLRGGGERAGIYYSVRVRGHELRPDVEIFRADKPFAVARWNADTSRLDSIRASSNVCERLVGLFEFWVDSLITAEVG